MKSRVANRSATTKPGSKIVHFAYHNLLGYKKHTTTGRTGDADDPQAIIKTITRVWEVDNQALTSLRMMRMIILNLEEIKKEE